jgi:DNA-binding CsgD family transcriptional regulator
MPDKDAGPLHGGRTAQARQLLGLLRSARSGEPSLAVISGRQGMGKTSLLETFLGGDDVANQDTTVLRAAGSAWEQHVDFGVIRQLLTKCPDGGRKQDGPESGQQADSVQRANTVQRADSVQRYGEALLAAMNTVTGSGQTLILGLSDIQLADTASLQALLYALRRVGPLPLLTVLSIDPDPLGPDPLNPYPLGPHPLDSSSPDPLRAGEGSLPADAGITGLLRFPAAATISLGPLRPDEVQDMWRGSGAPELTLPAARALVEHTGGRPSLIRALLEQFPAAVWSASPEALPAPAECVSFIAAALRRMSAEGAALTQAAAVLGIRTQFALAAELAGIKDAVAAVDAAHTAGLLRVSTTGAETRLEFALPVYRAAVYQHLGPARRAALHTEASRIMAAPVQRLKHRSAAALLPDRALAAELEASADGFASSGAWHPAAEAYAQAARLNPQPEERESLVVRAVDAMVGAGELPRAVAALDALESFAPGPRTEAVRGHLAILRGRPAQADALLQKAWTAVDPATDPGTAAGICQRQVLHALAGFHGRDLVTWAERAKRLAPPGSPAAVEAQAIEGLGLGFMGLYDEAEQSYRDADRLPEHGAQHQRLEMGKGWLHLAMDRMEEARAELAGAVPTEFAHGSQRISLWAQGWLARADFALGAWDDALRTVQAAVVMQEESGIELLRPLLHWSGAQIQALRGNWDEAASHLERGAAASDSYPAMLLPYCLAQAQVAETKADYDGVIRSLMPVLRMQRTTGIDEPGFWPWQDHYANALVMTGRVDEADAFLIPHEQLAERRGHRSTRARLAYVRGRIHAANGDLDAARTCFLGGLAQLDGLPLPFARARVKFAYGQSFRRAGKRREAAAVLTEARELFAVLGAGAYVDRCSREMRATGVSSDDPAGGGGSGRATQGQTAGPPDLTEQEKAVAALVASGLSNKEAAAELYVSVKTVQYHLTRIYSKLGVTSRSGLAAVYPGRTSAAGTAAARPASASDGS